PRSVGGQTNQMFNPTAQQGGGQMMNGQGAGQSNMSAQQQKQMMQKAQFFKSIQNHAQQQNRPFNPRPTVGGQPVDLYMLWFTVAQLGGSDKVEKAGQWPLVANKMGFSQPQATEELKNLHLMNSLQYERLYFTMEQQRRQERAR